MNTSIRHFVSPAEFQKLMKRFGIESFGTHLCSEFTTFVHTSTQVQEHEIQLETLTQVSYFVEYYMQIFISTQPKRESWLGNGIRRNKYRAY
jgi:hypothetical protein